MPLANPYLDFFCALPASFRRGSSWPSAAAGAASTDGALLKAAIARHFAWAVPTAAVVDRIGRYARGGVIEIGAGSGYWAWLLRQAGIDVLAFDHDPPAFTWTAVASGDGREALVRSPQRALLLCWPPWASPMAFDALQAYGGACVVYVGEWMLGSAEAGFFALLLARFEAVDAVALPQWHGRADGLSVWRRRT
jgi:hypothetical protein